MKQECPVCHRKVGVNDEGQFVKHRLGRSPRHLRVVRGTRGGKGFSEHRPVKVTGERYVPQPVCEGSRRVA